MRQGGIRFRRYGSSFVKSLETTNVQLGADSAESADSAEPMNCSSGLEKLWCSSLLFTGFEEVRRRDSHHFNCFEPQNHGRYA